VTKPVRTLAMNLIAWLRRQLQYRVTAGDFIVAIYVVMLLLVVFVLCRLTQ
jgi:hypothetical protein